MQQAPQPSRAQIPTWAQRPAAVLLALACGACQGLREFPLASMPDCVDANSHSSRRRGNLADAGMAPRMRHPRDLSFELLARFVEAEDESELDARAFQVEVRVRNGSSRALTLLAAGWWLVDDAGARYRENGLVRWDEEKEEWLASSGQIDAGNAGIFVARFSVGRSFSLAHLLRVTLHWSYAHERKTYAVATGFRSR